MTYEPTIHVIDDDPAILASLSLLLTAEGYAVHTHQSVKHSSTRYDKAIPVACDGHTYAGNKRTRSLGGDE